MNQGAIVSLLLLLVTFSRVSSSDRCYLQPNVTHIVKKDIPLDLANSRKDATHVLHEEIVLEFFTSRKGTVYPPLPLFFRVLNIPYREITNRRITHSLTLAQKIGDGCTSVLDVDAPLKFTLKLSLFKDLHPTDSKKPEHIPIRFTSYLGFGKVEDLNGNNIIDEGSASATFFGNIDSLVDGTHGGCLLFTGLLIGKNGNILEMGPTSEKHLLNPRRKSCEKMTVFSRKPEELGPL